MNRVVGFGCLVCGLFLGGGAVALDLVPAPSSRVSGLAYDGSYVYLGTAEGLRTIFRLDPGTLEVVGSFLAPTGSGLDGYGNPNDLVAVGPDRLFVSDIADPARPDTGLVWEVDTAGTEIRQVFDLPFRGGALASDGEFLYAGDFDSTEILVTTLTGATVRSFDSSVRSAGLVYEAASGTLWAISQFDSLLVQLSPSGQVLRTCDSPRVPDWYQAAVTIVDGTFLIVDSSTEVSEATPATIYVIERGELSCSPSLSRPMGIDVMPGHPANVVHPQSGGSIHVALLGDETVDVGTIALSTLRVGEAGLPISYERAQSRDVNDDGYLDVVLRLRIADLGVRCGDPELRISVETEAGDVLVGADAIQTQGCPN